MLQSNNISFRPSSPLRDSKKFLESNHCIIRSILRRLKEESSTLPLELAALRAIRMSNELYGLPILSAFEMANGFTRPISGDVKIVSFELIEAQLQLAAKRNLAEVFSSKNTADISLS